MVTNGRLIPLEGLQPLLAEDFRLLDQFANTAQVAKQVEHVCGSSLCISVLSRL